MKIRIYCLCYQRPSKIINEFIDLLITTDRCRSKYDLKIVMFMKEIVYFDAWTVTFCFRASKDLGQNGYGDINHVGNKA